ncbi:uncharacterized protein At4g04775 isoform X2 [Brassica rapa]|uniref:uncharacterized protein At4g04775 isoform X2 n=1 Tax=Brassica campestris TaxID=3711 RepID=UPI00142E176A|nr:uncharacterized protein At4g04775 isoform X2 [Brassica rapa]
MVSEMDRVLIHLFVICLLCVAINLFMSFVFVCLILIASTFFFSGLVIMGQDYSYTQPSSSDELDLTYLLESEAQIYKDEAESSLYIAESFQYTPSPEADDGIPTTCYCGSEPEIATSHTHKDPGRRYYTCPNVDDGECHIWKWWDVAVTEEMTEVKRQMRLLKDQAFQCDQNVVKLQKTVCEVQKTVCEQKKSVWEVKKPYMRIMVSVLTVLLGFAVMYMSGISSKK